MNHSTITFESDFFKGGKHGFVFPPPEPIYLPRGIDPKGNEIRSGAICKTRLEGRIVRALVCLVHGDMNDPTKGSVFLNISTQTDIIAARMMKSKKWMPRSFIKFFHEIEILPGARLLNQTELGRKRREKLAEKIKELNKLLNRNNKPPLLLNRNNKPPNRKNDPLDLIA
jgi:hypothetical protein